MHSCSARVRLVRMKSHLLRTALLLLLLATPGMGQELSSFLQPLMTHPGLAASSAQLRLEEARLASARDPLTLSMTYGYNAFAVSDEYDWLPEPIGELFMPPDSAAQLTLDLTLRPVPFGDIKDMFDQAQLQLGLAELSWRETLTGLQVAAVTTAYSLHLAEDSLQLALEGVELARDAERATELRFENGAATERELRDSRAATTEAETLAQTALAGVELARLALTSLVGQQEAPPREQLRLGVPEGEAASVQRAELQAGLARVGARNARRSVYPVLQTGYTHYLDDQSSVGVSIESRTLQPNLNYTYQTVARAFPESLIEGNFTIGVSASISPAITAALAAAAAQEEAAQQGVDAARQQAETERARLHNQLLEAERQLDLADLLYRNATADLEETRTRQELGLAIPLETQQAVLAVMRAELELGQARQTQLERTLAFHEFTAQPIVEVTPQ